MIKTMNIKEASNLWDISTRRISELCKEGRIEGAKKVGRNWLIPINATKPNDGRIKSGSYKKNSEKNYKLPLPIGISDYRLASKEYYYADKTLMIKDILDEKVTVSLFTRPRRFGKTLNMNMLQTYFEKTEEDTSIYFQDKLIWKQDKKYRDHQGKYPVIFLSFKDVKFTSWTNTFEAIRKIISLEANRHNELLNSNICSEYDKRNLNKLISMDVSEVELASSLLDLSRMLHQHYDIAPIVIIDEYDTPIEQGHIQGFYDEVILFMRNLFSNVLKDNRHLSFGFLTGILKVAKGLNNITTNSILDDKYSEYFGFTRDEIKDIVSYYSINDKYDEICNWYDGYRFGEKDIFNPWSVLNYLRNDFKVGAYWQSTGSNDIIGEILPLIDNDTAIKLIDLIDGKEVVSSIDIGIIYPEVKNNVSSIFSFLLVAGYLKAVKKEVGITNDYICSIAIPNKEIDLVYRKEILSKMSKMFPMSCVTALQEALYKGDSLMLQNSLRNLLLQSVSYLDTSNENFYQGLMLGLTATLNNYESSSNKESGEGRYDIELKPKVANLPGIIIELKAGKNHDDEELEKLAMSALKQIEDKKYDYNMRSNGIENIIKYGVSFSGKNVKVLMSISNN